MSDKELVPQGQQDVPAIADDYLIAVANQAEKRIEAVNKIKRVALTVTNPRDWTDQNGNPYLMVSGAEKIANLFNISWRIEEPLIDEEADGHHTVTYRGTFTLGGRSIEAIGTRSSKDPFFRTYVYKDGVRTLAPPSAVDRGDVKKAALTNLLGNGITRILGIRNLTWADLKQYAKIEQNTVAKVDYKSTAKTEQKPPIQKPQASKTPPADQSPPPKGAVQEPGDPATAPQIAAINKMLGGLGIHDDYARHEKVSRLIGHETAVIASLSVLTREQASTVIGELGKELDASR